ncbi:hypothetical protein OS493_038652, partial [Desmophyllum pertusum]
AMPKQKSNAASAVGGAAVGIGIFFSPVGWAAFGAAAITGICAIAIAKIQQHEETEERKRKRRNR